MWLVSQPCLSTFRYTASPCYIFIPLISSVVSIISRTFSLETAFPCLYYLKFSFHSNIVMTLFQKCKPCSLQCPDYNIGKQSMTILSDHCIWRKMITSTTSPDLCSTLSFHIMLNQIHVAFWVPFRDHPWHSQLESDSHTNDQSFCFRKLVG